MDLALLSTRSFSFFPPYAELTLIMNKTGFKGKFHSEVLRVSGLLL
ncbi:hypothetical protein [Leptospira noguchii]|uniref:Uncharacterized protein n=1 Tax=Leptospira noguchii TaxID=28182 RepID=A0AAE9GJG8_9LEPT|nr:hypothetical protein [Leptospira noguchii]UOG58781.1 hypothetical protein MAL03_20285 [Leptospira noguchii]